MICIECKMSKNGNEYIVLTVNGVYVSFDSNVILKVARTNGLSQRDVYSLAVGDKILITD